MIPNLSFCAIDVETANPWPGSICQIGIVEVADGKVAREWSTLVDPEGPFSPFNIRIHGISEAHTRHAPPLPRIHEAIRDRLEGCIVVSHTAFDRGALDKACGRYGLPVPRMRWLDSARVARRAWPAQLARRGFSLGTVAAHLGIRFRHHDALEDARAAALIILAAHRACGLDVDGWIGRVERPIAWKPPPPEAGGG